MADVLLPADLPALNRAIFLRAQRDVPQLEDPPGSNRSPYLDALCDKWQVPRGSYWCAGIAAEVWRDAGAETPPIDDAKGWHPWKAQTWYEWALHTARFDSRPAIGCAVVYGAHGHAPAEHLGTCVASVTPFLLDFEGNTTLDGYARNGEIYTAKSIRTDRLIGYIHPLPPSLP